MLNIGKNHTKHMKMTSTKPWQIPRDLRTMSLRVLMKSDRSPPQRRVLAVGMIHV